MSVLLAFGVTLTTVFSAKSATQIEDLRADIERKQQENERLAREIDEIKTKLRALNERTDVKEKLIREDTGFVRADELLFQFKDKDGPKSEPGSP
ncbi:MAG: septum formation initiator family protein [Deltaproteobacteria bacterium]|nr:septum formation initiator family protein [Deltaproteobacteria bacterium]